MIPALVCLARPERVGPVVMERDTPENADAAQLPAPPQETGERCPECGGTGRRDGGECPACEGTGNVMHGLGGG